MQLSSTQSVSADAVVTHAYESEAARAAKHMIYMQGVKCIPASDIAASEAAFQGVTVTSLKEYPQVCWH